MTLETETGNVQVCRETFRVVVHLMAKTLADEKLTHNFWLPFFSVTLGDVGYQRMLDYQRSDKRYY